MKRIVLTLLFCLWAHGAMAALAPVDPSVQKVDPTGTTTQPVSAVSLPLPSGAATAAKQPALGTAGTPSTDVITIQGHGSGTPVKTDGSATTQPISASSLPLPSGAATAANQTNGQGTVGAGTAAANSNLSGCTYNSTELSPTNGQGMAAQCDSKGRGKVTLRDAAGNDRGVNVTATNDAQVQTNSSGATGSAPPSRADYMGAMVGGNLVGAIKCGATATYDASTTGSTQIVAASGSTVIYICGYAFTVGGTATNVKLVYGTGTNCATSPANLTPAYQIAANGGIVDGASEFRGLKTTASQALCINASAANAVQAIVYYTQF